MRTALFVYEPLSLSILTNELGLELCRMNAAAVPLLYGENIYSISPGIYKIVSDQDIHVKGDTNAFDLVATTSNKTDVPEPPPSRAQFFGPLDPGTLAEFFAVPESKFASNP